MDFKRLGYTLFMTVAVFIIIALIYLFCNLVVLLAIFSMKLAFTVFVLGLFTTAICVFWGFNNGR
jgi:hypothetical protein